MKKKAPSFAWIMVILSVIAVLLGVAVFYWLLQYEPVRTLAETSSLALLAANHIGMLL